MSDKYLFFEKNIDDKLEKLNQIKGLRWINFVELKASVRGLLNREIRKIILINRYYPQGLTSKLNCDMIISEVQKKGIIETLDKHNTGCYSLNRVNN